MYPGTFAANNYSCFQALLGVVGQSCLRDSQNILPNSDALSSATPQRWKINLLKLKTPCTTERVPEALELELT